MGQEEKSLQPRQGTADHVVNMVKAALSSLPFTGGIASLIADYVPRSTGRAIWQAIGFLNEKLQDLGDRIDTGGIDEDEFSDTVKSFLMTIQKTSQEEKLRGAANLLANVCLKDGESDKLPYTEIDHFFRCLESLSVGAIYVLGVVCKMVEARGTRKSPAGEYTLTYGDIVPEINNLPPHTIISLMSELNSLNLLRLETATISLATQGYQENYQAFLTPMGVKFVKHVLGPQSERHDPADRSSGD